MKLVFLLLCFVLFNFLVVVVCFCCFVCLFFYRKVTGNNFFLATLGVQCSWQSTCWLVIPLCASSSKHSSTKPQASLAFSQRKHTQAFLSWFFLPAQ